MMNYLQRLLKAFFSLFGAKKQPDAGKNPSSGRQGGEPTASCAPAENRDIPKAEQIRRTIPYPPLQKVPQEMLREETAGVSAQPEEQAGAAAAAGGNAAPGKPVPPSLEEEPTESFHWHASGENAFTLCKNDTRKGTGIACAAIALQRKMPISFPEVQSPREWEPLALHAAQLVLAPFCEGQAAPPRIIESVQDGSVILTCELPEETDKEERSLITVMFTEKMAYLLTGTASQDVTTEQYSKDLPFRSN